MANSKSSLYNWQLGLSIIEIILAMAILIIIASSGVTVILHSLAMNRLSAEQSQASFIALEGMEAVRSIRNFNFTNLTAGTYGVDASGDTWVLSGSADTLDDYTRTMRIQDVYRDLSGNIVDSGGSLDPDTKKITSHVSWSFSLNRNNNLNFINYLTNWKKALPIVGDGGMIVYADLSGATDDKIFYRLFDGTSWSYERQVPDFNVPGDRDTRVVELYASATRDEKILVTKHFEDGTDPDQYLFAQVWDGDSWGNVVQLASWAGATLPQLRDFDGDYLDNGDFLLAYEDDSNTVKYRTWNGASWSSQSDGPDIGGNPDYLVLKARPNTDEAMLAVRDNGNDTNTARYADSSWSIATEHASNSTGTDYENLDLVWSSNSSDTLALIFNETNDTSPDIKIWDSSTWSADVENADIGGEPWAMQVIAKPDANEFLACFDDNALDINCLESDFSPSWSTLTGGELETQTDGGSQRTFDLAYENSGNQALVVYSGDPANDQPKYVIYDPSTNTFGSENSLGSITSTLEAVRIIPSPVGDDLMVLMPSSDQHLWTAVWNGSANQFYSSGVKALTEQSTDGSNDLDYWFDFEWDKY